MSDREITQQARKQAIREVVELLTMMAEDAERYGHSAMGKLYELAKAEAFREAARKVEDMR